MKWLKKLLKKDTNKMTPEQLQSLRETLSATPLYQWVKTERAGTVCRFQDVMEDDGLLFVGFDDGSRVNYNLLDEMLVRLNSEQEAMQLGGDPISLDQPLNTIGKATIRNAATATVKDSPIHGLLKKQKPNKVGVDISLDLNMPPKELYKVLESSFENAQEEIVEYIVADINIENIRAAVKDAIKKFYE